MATSACAVYARYSSHQQRPASIDDQLRRCFEYAAKNGWEIDPRHVYTDERQSGVGSDRTGYRAMLDAVLSKRPQVRTILVDDTSRLSRSLAEVVNLQQRLLFKGVRLISVSQGIDSENEQAELLLTIHGLVDSLYIKELANKTHRGLEGVALRGLHTGGRCLGYRSQAVEGGFRLSIVPEEAKVVRRVFKLYAEGLSLKRVARQLTSEGIKTPRTRRGKDTRAWPHTGIREMLRRERYIGVLIWNRRKYVKCPGSNKRVARLRPEQEWVKIRVPQLRIVSDLLWEKVQERVRVNANAFSKKAKRR